MRTLHVAAGFLLASFVAACGDPAPRKRSNVILITLDTVRADFVSCYGVHANVTPNLDALAAAGTRFDMAISTAGVTPVSHASILTGLNNQSHELRVLAAESGYTLPKDVPTLATVLANQGYHTVAVHSAFPVSRNFGFERGFEVFEDLNTELVHLSNEAKQVKSIWDVKNFQRRSDETTALVERSLRAQEPFFLWLHYWDPHDFDKLPPAERLEPREKFFDESGEPLRPGIELYKEELKYQDEQIGRLFKWLKERKLDENTIVVITADHGQGLHEHGWAAHRLLYQEQVHVPLILVAPGATQRPVVTELVRTIDVYPTVLDYLGLKAPKAVEGRSLRALIEGRADEKRIAFADQINGYDTNAGMAYREDRKHDQFLYMALDWPHKLIYRPLHPEHSELYDLGADPDEARNLYATEPERATQLRRELAKARPWVRGPFEKAGSAGQDEAARAALRDLGYVDGETLDPNWSWTCPEHLDEVLADESKRCSRCKSPPLMIKR